MLLNNPLFDADEILRRINQSSSHGITALEKTRRQLKDFYFKNATDNAEIRTALENAPFDDFLRLKYVLSQLFPSPPIEPQDGPPTQSSSAITQVEETQVPLESQEEIIETQIPADLHVWQPNLSFTVINEKYGYFNEDLSFLFNKLAVACRQMTGLIEHQAYDDEMAYKLMVLFCEPQKSREQNFEIIAKKFAKLITTKQDKTIKTPFHDAFVTELNHLPKFNDVHDFRSWQAFIAQEGFKALSIFSQCAHLQPAFNNIKEAQNFLLKQTYPHADENPKLARLCKSMLISNKGFEAGLQEVKTGWPKKERDNLPIVDIADTSGQYFWVKLPPQDMRALYLGNLIPGCCQFINGHSSQCVKDGIRLSDNGFYVLLKAKKSHTAFPRVENNEINDKNYDIVAQSYAWISNHGNLCLDSLEWNKERVTIPVIQDLMSKFCDLVLHVHPTIQYINVGIGGQTPKNIYPLCDINETLKQGIMYMDSKQQYQIGARIIPEVKTTLQRRLERFSEPFIKQAILYLSPYFENIETIPDALVSINSEVTDTLPWFLKRINLPPQLSIEDFRHITFDNFQRMSEQEKAQISTVCKIFNSPTENELSQWLPTIPNEELNYISIIKNDYSPELQITLLRRLPPEEQLKALHELDLDNHSLFEKYLKKPEYLKTILEFYTPEELYMAIITENKNGESLIHFLSYRPQYLLMVIERLPEQLLFETLIHIDRQNFSILENMKPEWLAIFLKKFSTQNRINFAKAKNNTNEKNIFAAARHPDIIKIYTEILTPEEFLQAVQEGEQYSVILWYAKNKLESLKVILEHCPPNQRLSLIKEHVNHSTLLSQLIKKPASFRFILEIYPSEERLQALYESNGEDPSLIETLRRFPASFGVALELLPKEISLTIQTYLEDENVFEYASSLQKFMNDMKELAPPKPLSHFIEALFKNEAVDEALQVLLTMNTSLSLFSSTKSQAILNCIEQLHPFWKKGILPTKSHETPTQQNK